ncbi:COP23 domain-containing protein [Sphaerothrix gracilis]|uniref:COP23 domain-containing protein n=1 Tax=Sphaerothrix gracilis TaxID=3151835 RepID=UPI0031FDB2FF
MGRLEASLLAAAIAAATITGRSPAVKAEVTFACLQQEGIPTTVAQTAEGTVTLVEWTAAEIAIAPTRTPQTECEAATQQFQTYLTTGNLTYITTGRMDGELVTCVAQRPGGGCRGRLFALQAEIRPRAALQRILRIRVPNDGPIEETGPRLYVSWDRYLQGDYPALPTAAPRPSNSAEPHPEVEDELSPIR